MQRNFIAVSGVGWLEATSQGATGDWILRLVLVPEPSSALLQLLALGALAALVRRRA